MKYNRESVSAIVFIDYLTSLDLLSGAMQHSAGEFFIFTFSWLEQELA